MSNIGSYIGNLTDYANTHDSEIKPGLVDMVTIVGEAKDITKIIKFKEEEYNGNLYDKIDNIDEISDLNNVDDKIERVRSVGKTIYTNHMDSEIPAGGIEMVKIVGDKKSSESEVKANTEELVVNDKSIVEGTPAITVKGPICLVDMVKTVDDEKTSESVAKADTEGLVESNKSTIEGTSAITVTSPPDGVEMIKNVEGKEPVKPENLLATMKELFPEPHDSAKKIKMYGDDKTGFVFNGEYLYYDNIEVMNACVEIVDVIMKEDGSGFYMCDIYMKDQRVIHKKVPTSKYASGTWLTDIVGFCFRCSKGQAAGFLHRYLQALVDTQVSGITKIMTCEEFGWKNVYGKYYYITPLGVIGHPELKLESGCGQKFSKLILSEKEYRSSFGNYLSFLDIAGNDSNIGPILILYTAMSLCHELFKSANTLPKFSIFLHGKAGSFKTSLAIALTQIEFTSSPKLSLKSTVSYMEDQFKEYKDCVILADDLAPLQSPSARKKLEETLDAVVRAYGDNVTRQTNANKFLKDKDDDAKPFVSGGAIITGEYVTGCGSSLARSLFLEVDKYKIDTGLLKKIQDEEHVVENFAIAFISSITTMLENGTDIIGFIHDTSYMIMSENSGKYSNSRYGEYIAHLQTTADLIMWVARSFQLLSERDIACYYNRFINAIERTVLENNERSISHEPITVICSAIKHNLGEENAKLCKKGKETYELTNVVFEDDDYYYITQKHAAMLVNNYANIRKIQQEYTSHSVAKILNEKGVIDSHMEGSSVRYGIKLAYGGNSRYMVVKKAELLKHVKVIN